MSNAMQCLATSLSKKNSKDNLDWCNHKDFTVKSLYLKAVAQTCHGAVVDSLICSVWQNIAHPKDEFMIWLALLGKLNIKDMLARKGMLPAEANYYTFCNSHNEDLHHLLISCSVSWSIYSSIASDLGQNITTPSTLNIFYEDWINRKISNKV